MRRYAPIFLLIAAPIAACSGGPKPDFNSAEPAARNAAIVRAARTNDQKAVPDLIRLLDSDDPATRLLASRTLERITGQTLGYDCLDSETQRRQAVEAWTNWYAVGRAEPAKSGQ